MTIQVLLLLFSFVLLYYGAEFALEQAEVIGRYFHLSPLVIGVLIVGFGTSLPEFFVSQLACFRDVPGIALGNIVGSNIGNIFLILGISLLLVPIGVASRSLKEQFGFHIIITGILIWILTRQQYNWSSAILLVLAFMVYLYLTFQRMRSEQRKNSEIRDATVELSWKAPVLLILGFVLLYAGGELLVSSGKVVGRALGMSEYVLSAIVVAFGTSFPELITALIACKKRKDVNLIIGNIIGSNIFNAAFVLGSLGLYSFPIKTNFTVELSVLGTISIYFLLLSFIRQKIFRLHGLLFLSIYGGVVWYWIQSTGQI
jgi:cation:H+ antiporter